MNEKTMNGRKEFEIKQEQEQCVGSAKMKSFCLVHLIIEKENACVNKDKT